MFGATGLEDTVSALQNRLESKFEVRATESIAGAISGIEPGQTINLAQDTWTYNDTLVITKSCAIVGHPLGTKIKRGEGLTSGPLVDIQADDVVLQNIYFEDATSLGDVVCVQADTNSRASVVSCVMDGFSEGFSSSGQVGHMIMANNIVLATSKGISIDGSSSSHRIVLNSITTSPASNPAVNMTAGVSSCVVSGNLTNSSIVFTNAGSAQTFAAPGGNNNHVAGNVASLTETT